MLANANVKELEEEEEDNQDTEVDLEANRQKRIRKKDKTDTLTSEQMNQVYDRACFVMCKSPQVIIAYFVCITLYADMLAACWRTLQRVSGSCVVCNRSCLFAVGAIFLTAQSMQPFIASQTMPTGTSRPTAVIMQSLNCFASDRSFCLGFGAHC